MQQLKIEHKKSTTNSNQIVVDKKKTKDRREGKGRSIALSRRIYRLLQTDVFYVESESTDNVYYFVKFKPDVFGWCNCKDYSTRHTIKCKHLFAIEFAIKWGTLQDIDTIPSLLTTTLTSNELGPPNLSDDKLGETNLPNDKLGRPNNNNNNTNTNKTIKTVAPPPSIMSKSPSSYKDDDYSF